MSSVFNPTHLTDPSLVSLDLLFFSPLSSYLSSSSVSSFYLLIHRQSHWKMMSRLKSQTTSFSSYSLAWSKVHPPAAWQVDHLVLAASKGARTSRVGSHQVSSTVAIATLLGTAGTVIEVNHPLARNLETKGLACQAATIIVGTHQPQQQLRADPRLRHRYHLGPRWHRATS